MENQNKGVDSVVITFKDKESEDVAKYIKDQLSKSEEINKVETLSSIDRLNHTLSWGYYPLLTQYMKGTNQYPIDQLQNDYDTLVFWSKELPNAPQGIQYIKDSIFALGYTLVYQKKGDPDERAMALKSQIEHFIRKADENGTSLVELSKTIVEDTCRVADGYFEKIFNRAKSNLVYIDRIAPLNMLVLVDENLAKKGILRVIGYAKVDDIRKYQMNKDNVKALRADSIPDGSKLNTKEVLHLKYNDKGDAYGHSAWEGNQETTKLVINVLNERNKVFTNEIRSAFIVELPPRTTKVDADMFLAHLKTQYLGKNNWGKPLVLYNGIKAVPVQGGGIEFNYEEFMTNTGKRHAPTLLGIDPSEIDNKDAQYTNASWAHIKTVLNTVNPWKAKMERVWDELFRDVEGLTDNEYKPGDDIEVETPQTWRVHFKREDISTMYMHLMALNGAATSGYMSPNEARRILDPNELPEIQEDWANKHYMKLGKELVNMDDEMFSGTDEVEQSYLEKDGGKLVSMNQFFKKK